MKRTISEPLVKGLLILGQGNWEYTCTKYALRGLMRTARWSGLEQGIRINFVAPCYIKSAIRTAETEKCLRDKGVEFGYPEDVATCMMRIATDKAINGKSACLLQLCRSNRAM